MRPARGSRRSADEITVTVGRFGSLPEKVTMEKDSTVRDALDDIGITVSAGETIYVNGERANVRDLLDDGDVLNVVTPKEAGA